MSEAGGVVLVRATEAEAPGAAMRVAGLTVVERAVRQLLRSGRRVLVATDGTVPLPQEAERVDVADEAALAALRSELGNPPEVPADVVRPGGGERLDGGVRVTDEASRRRAEDVVFAHLLRGDLGVVARHLNKPISFRVTRHLLCRLPVTPNQVTLGAAAIGLVGCALIATGQQPLIVLGLALAQVQSVLDGCDGELARVRFQQSAIGEWLDTIVDDGMNLALVLAITAALWRTQGSLVMLGLGLGAAAMLLVYNVVAYRELVRQGEGGYVLKVRWWFAGDALHGEGKPGPLRFLVAIGRRDFFVLAWLVMGALGLLPLVLLYAAIIAAASFVAAVGQLMLQRAR